MLSSIVPIKGLKEEVLLFFQGKIECFNINSGNHYTLIELGRNFPEMRPNDAKASPEGRLWVGMMHLTNHHKTGFLWRIDPDLSIHPMLKNQHIPNGMVWNAAGDKMYYADSGRGCIEEYAYDTVSGNIRFSKIAVNVPSEMGVPDGMTIDADGNLWVAHWGGFGVYVWNPENGTLINKVTVPVPNVASCTFAGKNRARLFITTARAGLSASDLLAYPFSGSLFCADTDVTAGENHYSFNLPSPTFLP